MKISELISKNIYFLLFILILKINISFETSLLPSIKIYAEDMFKVTCDSHFFYISMQISSDTEIITPVSFEMYLSSPSNLNIIKNNLNVFVLFLKVLYIDKKNYFFIYFIPLLKYQELN